MRRISLRLGARLALLLCAAPGPAFADAGEAAPGLEARLHLEQEDGRTAISFAPGEAVVLVLGVRNATDATQTVSLSSARTHDFAISSAGREIWRWSAGRRFAQMLSEISLAPGEEKSFRATWIPGADATGCYRAEGWTGDPGAEIRADPTDLHIH